MKHKWHKGPPPSIGWWPASLVQDEQAIRWWDGKRWSYVATPEDNAKKASRVAEYKSSYSAWSIQWTNRWWEVK